MTNKYFNVTEHERKEKRKEILATTFVWSVLVFAAIGVLATFSLLLTMIWS